MRMRQFGYLVVGWVVVAVLAGCAANGNAPIEAANSGGKQMVKSAETPSPKKYRFYPGDELSVTAVNRPELTVADTRVDPYGYITYPYLGQVYVKGLTSSEVAENLAKALQDGDFYRRVSLGVSFVRSKEQYIYVLGEVKKPGPIAITGSIPLLDAIGKAGGQTYDAEMSTVLWIRGRQSPPGVVKLNLAALGDARASNPIIPRLTLAPGDVLYVPDSVITSVQRFFNRMYDILRSVVVLENGIVLYDSAERVLSGRYHQGGGGTTIIVTPFK